MGIRRIAGLPKLLLLVLVGLAMSAATPLPGDRKLDTSAAFRDCDTCPEIVLVPAGSYVMGANGLSNSVPPHAVTFERPFAMGKFLVTRGEFAAFVADTGYKAEGACWTMIGADRVAQDVSWRAPGFAQDDRHPVVCVDWNDARAYAAWLSRKTGKTYRLPSEAEWEYAARAGTTPHLSFSDPSSALCRQGNGFDRSALAAFAGAVTLACDDGYIYTAPVGSFPANAFGLYDMLGNAWQWLDDCLHQSFAFDGAPTNGAAWTDGSCKSRVLRGGAWSSSMFNLNPYARIDAPAGWRTGSIGFRVVRTPEP